MVTYDLPLSLLTIHVILWCAICKRWTLDHQTAILQVLLPDSHYISCTFVVFPVET